MSDALIILGDIQIPLLAAMLLGGCAAKLARTVARRSVEAGLGPTILFPLRMRKWVAGIVCAIELGLGIGLIVTAGPLGERHAAQLVRLGTASLFLVATCALIELRSERPDVGCGCFGELSTSPVTGRTLARSALLALAALGITSLRPIQLQLTPRQAALAVALLAAEAVTLGLLSPEFREVLVRTGYSTPCELRVQRPDQSLAALQRSSAWHRHASLIVDPEPSDMWRELCWRYITFPGRLADRDAELVFAVYLQHRRPTVLAVVVDSHTGAVLSWPASTPRSPVIRQPRALRRSAEQRSVSGSGAF